MSDLDKAASEACTRSGAFGLLLAVVLFLLTSYWITQKNDLALGEYLSARHNLSIYMDTLEQDQLWVKYKDTHQDADSMPIGKLFTEGLTQESTTVSEPPQQGSPKNPKRGTSIPTSPSKPQPPTNLKATVVSTLRFYEMEQIVGSFRKLNNPEMLARSRDVSNFFSFSITRWIVMQQNLIYTNMLAGICEPQEFIVTQKSQRASDSIPEITRAALDNCLTFRDARKLAQYELPTLSNPTPIGGHVQRDVDVSPGSLPRDPLASSIVVQILLFSVLIYFGAFASEAIASESFPARGTLFGAFAGSRMRLLALFTAIWLPSLASVLVSITAWKWQLALCSAAILLSTLPAVLALNRKNYFTPVVVAPIVAFEQLKRLLRVGAKLPGPPAR